jgi:hypothetical protein
MSDVSDRDMEEYKAGLENLAEFGDRRLATSAIFVGFNTIALTGVGALLVSSRLSSWKTPSELALIAFAILPVNGLWIRALVQYKRGLDLRYAFLQRLEVALFPNRGYEERGLVSVLHRVRPNGKYGHRHTSLEIALAIYFFCLFPITAAIVAAITFTLQQGIFPNLH